MNIKNINYKKKIIELIGIFIGQFNSINCYNELYLWFYLI